MADPTRLTFGPEDLWHSGAVTTALLGYQGGQSVGDLDVDALLSTEKPALIDTGALENYVDISVPQRHGLRRSGSGSGIASTAGGYAAAAVYVGHLYLPELDRKLLSEFVALDLVGSGLDYSMVLGREFLRPYIFAYDGVGGSVYFMETGSDLA